MSVEAKAVEIGATCARCQQTVTDTGSICKVPHPEHLQQVVSGSMGFGGVSHNFQCGACDQEYSKTASDHDCPLSKMSITKGSKWCYEGPHTSVLLPHDDQRRVRKDVIILRAGPDIQDRIDALDGNEQVRVLKICSEGMYESDFTPNLAIRLPNLEELQTVDVGMGRIKLTRELTPKVRKIWMQNPTEDTEPQFEMDCPELEDFSCYYWGPGNFGWLLNMLNVATKLKRFDSYKLRVGYLRFASNHLESIRLHRAELLERIDLWAPRLTNLDVQAAYDLEQIHFLKNHPLENDLPNNFSFNQELHVNVMNASLGQHAVSAIEAHDRFHGSLEEDDDYW